MSRFRHVIADGHGYSHVPVQGAGFARVDADALDRLRAAGLSLAWFTATDERGALHVRAPSQAPARHPVLNVARLLTAAAPWERVRFLDGDRLNLTRANLHKEDRRKKSAVLQACGNEGAQQ